MSATANPVIRLEDDRFRVTEWQFAPGAKTGWHVHGHDYVVVPLTGGTLGLEHKDGSEVKVPLTPGIPYSRRCGVEHDVANAGSEYLAFLEVEVIDDALARRRTETLKRLGAGFNARDVDAIMECVSDNCAFHSAAGPDVEGTRYVGRAAVRAAYEALFVTYVESHYAESNAYVTGDTGLSTWRFIGKERDGKVVDVRGVDVFTFDGDLVSLKDSYRKARS